MSVSPDAVRIGTELLGYRIEALLGRGGMGVVYRAYDPRLKRNVALKLIAPEFSEDAHFRERFLAETELAASLEHPNVVPIHDAGEVDGQLYLVMRYVEGGELKRLLHQEGSLGPGRAVAICGQIGAALDAAHGRGLVHRDVKPSNVLLDENEHVYLADFGLSRRLAEPGIPAGTGLSLGTPAYAAPEQIQGGDVDGRADMYSLGCVLYECLTGGPPYSRDSELALLWAHIQEPPPKPSEREPGLAPGIDAVIATALAKSPDDRYASCGELIEASSDALGLHPAAAHDRKAVILVTTGVAIVAAAVVAGVLFATGSNGPAKPSTKPTIAPKVDSLQRIDPKTNRLIATIGGVGANPTAIAVGAGGVWIGSTDDGSVSVVNPKTDVVGPATVKSAEVSAIVIRDGEVLVANENGPMISIDPTTLKVSPKSNADYAGALATGWGALWVRGYQGLERINRAGDVITTVTEIGWDTFALAAGENGVWMVDDGFRAVYRVDPATNRVVARIALGFDPGGIAAGGGSVWVTNASGDAVARIDPIRNEIIGSTRVGRDPVGIAFGDGAVWVGNYEDGTVSRIDPRSGKDVATLRVGPYPGVIAVGGGGVWVVVRAA